MVWLNKPQEPFKSSVTFLILQRPSVIIQLDGPNDSDSDDDDDDDEFNELSHEDDGEDKPQVSWMNKS